MEQPRIWKHGKYRIVDHGGPGGLHVEQRSQDALGAEKFDAAMRVKADWVSIPWAVFNALWMEVSSQQYPAPEPAVSELEVVERPDEDAVVKERRRRDAERLKRNQRLGLSASA